MSAPEHAPSQPQDAAPSPHTPGPWIERAKLKAERCFDLIDGLPGWQAQDYYTDDELEQKRRQCLENVRGEIVGAMSWAAEEAVNERADLLRERDELREALRAYVGEHDEGAEPDDQRGSICHCKLCARARAVLRPQTAKAYGEEGPRDGR